MGSIAAGIATNLIGNKMLRLSVPVSRALGLGTFAAGCALAVKIHLQEPVADLSRNGGSHGSDIEADSDSDSDSDVYFDLDPGRIGSQGWVDSRAQTLEEALDCTSVEIVDPKTLVIHGYTSARNAGALDSSVLPRNIDTVVFKKNHMNPESMLVQQFSNFAETLVFEECPVDGLGESIAAIGRYVTGVEFVRMDLRSLNEAFAKIPDSIMFLTIKQCSAQGLDQCIASLGHHIEILTFARMDLSELGDAIASIHVWRDEQNRVRDTDLLFEDCGWGNTAAIFPRFPQNIKSLRLQGYTLTPQASFADLPAHVTHIQLFDCHIDAESMRAFATIPGSVNVLWLQNCSCDVTAMFSSISAAPQVLFLAECSFASADVFSSIPSNIASVAIRDCGVLQNWGGWRLDDDLKKRIIKQLRQNQGDTPRIIEIDGENDSGNPSD